MPFGGAANSSSTLHQPPGGDFLLDLPGAAPGHARGRPGTSRAAPGRRCSRAGRSAQVDHRRRRRRRPSRASGWRRCSASGIRGAPVRPGAAACRRAPGRPASRRTGGGCRPGARSPGCESGRSPTRTAQSKPSLTMSTTRSLRFSDTLTSGCMRQEARHQRRHVAAPEAGRRRDAQVAAGLDAAGAHAGFGIGQVGQQALAVFEEGAAFVRQRDAARGAHQQLDAQPLLRARRCAGRSPPAPRLRRAPRRSGCPGSPPTTKDSICFSLSIDVTVSDRLEP